MKIKHPHRKFCRLDAVCDELSPKRSLSRRPDAPGPRSTGWERHLRQWTAGELELAARLRFPLWGRAKIHAALALRRPQPKARSLSFAACASIRAPPPAPRDSSTT